MEELDAKSLEAFRAAKNGNLDEAKAFLEQFKAPDQRDNRPFFYYMALAEIASQEGADKDHANALHKFSVHLSAKKREVLGYNKPGMHDAADLTTNAPKEIADAKNAGFESLRNEDYIDAIFSYQKAIELEIADLKKLGCEVFE